MDLSWSLKIMAWRILQATIKSVAKNFRIWFELMIAGSQQQTYCLSAETVFDPYIWMVAVIFIKKLWMCWVQNINAAQTYQLVQYRYHQVQVLVFILFPNLIILKKERKKNHVPRLSPLTLSVRWYVTYYRTKHHSIPSIRNICIIYLPVKLR